MVEGWPPRWLTKPKSKTTDGDRITEFIEAYCRVTKDSIGGQAGELIEVRPWQQQLINSIFATNKDGGYLHRTALVGLPRKSGKSSIGSAIALFGLLVGPDGGEIYSCAGDRDQARIVFETAKRMVQLDEELSSVVKIYRDALEIPDSGSTYRVLSAEASSAEGLSPTLTIFDELHVQPNARLWDTMTLGSGARRNAMTLAITTAGVKGDRLGNDSICYQLYQHGKKVVNKEVEDPTYFFAWWEPKKQSADWKSDATWKEANPGYGDLSLADDFKSVIARTSESEFRTKRLNQWVSSMTSALPQGAWEALADQEKQIDLSTPVILSFDGSRNGDSTALIGTTVETIPHIFTIKVWEKDPNDADWKIPVDDVMATIRESYSKYVVKEIACDPVLWELPIQILEDENYPIVAFPNSARRMVGAWKTFFDGVMTQKFTHSNDPALNRHIANMVMKSDAVGDRPTKEYGTSPRKIDAAIAAIMGYNRACYQEPEIDPTEYIH